MKQHHIRTSLSLVACVLCAACQEAGPTAAPPLVKTTVINVSAPTPEKTPATPATEGPSLGRPVARSKPAPRALPAFRLEPVDLTTAVGQTPLQMWIDAGGRALGEGALGRIAGALSLVTWPEQDVVPTTVSMRDARDDRDTFARVFLHPTQPLPDRWYALRVARGVAETEPADDPANALTLDDGARVARFRVGSEPLLVSVRQHETSPGRFALVFDFSERVGPDHQLSPVSLNSAQGRPVRCETPSAAHGRTFTSLSLSCEETTLQPGLRLGVNAGLRSQSGPALLGREHKLVGADVQSRPDGSRYARLLPASARLGGPQ